MGLDRSREVDAHTPAVGLRSPVNMLPVGPCGSIVAAAVRRRHPGNPHGARSRQVTGVSRMYVATSSASAATKTSRRSASLASAM